MKWYFIVYSENNGRRVMTDNVITDQHPVEWLVEMIDSVPAEYDLILLFWDEISEQIALQYKERFE